MLLVRHHELTDVAYILWSDIPAFERRILEESAAKKYPEALISNYIGSSEIVSMGRRGVPVDILDRLTVVHIRFN